MNQNSGNFTQKLNDDSLEKAGIFWGQPKFSEMLNPPIRESKDIVGQTHQTEINHQKHILCISMKLSLLKNT
jgi:hypothetical protein